MRFTTWRYKRFHSSYVLGWMCAGLLVGLGLSVVLRLDALWGVVVIIIAVLATCLAKARWYAVMIATGCALLLGMMRGTYVAHELEPTRQLVGHQTTLTGAIAEDPYVTARGDTRLVLDNLRSDGRRYAGQIWLSIRGEKRYDRADTITVRANLKNGFGGYQASATYVTVVEHVPSHDPMIALRNHYSAAVKRAVVEPSASLGIGFVVGQKSSLPLQFDEQLRIVGLTHLVVASGYNLTILVRLAKRLFEKHSKYLVAFTSALLITGFIAISGASPSMVRAGIVAGLSIATWYYGRRFHPLLLILYVAAMTAMLNPLYIWADIGWWLSFLAFFGVMIVSPLLLRIVFRKQHVPSVMQIVSETTAAQVMTLPLILMVFGNFPVLAVVANVLSAPLVPVAMLLTFVGGVGAMLVPSIGMWVALPAEIILSYFVAVVRFLAAPAWAQQTLGISPFAMIVLYVMIGAAVVVLWRRLRFNFRAQSLVE